MTSCCFLVHSMATHDKKLTVNNDMVMYIILVLIYEAMATISN